MISSPIHKKQQNKDRYSSPDFVQIPIMETLRSRIAIIATAICTVTACATPPGKLKDSDFAVRTFEVQQNVPAALSAFYEGLRYCSRHGIPDCAPMFPDGRARCDLYIAAGFGGRSDFVLGRADFVPTPTGSTVSLRVQTFVAKKETYFDAWTKYVQNRADEVCP